MAADPCGPGCYQSKVPGTPRLAGVGGPRRHDVRVRAADAAPRRDGSAIVAHAATVWNGLKTLVWHERLASEPDRRAPASSTGPSRRTSSRTRSPEQSAAVIIGGTRWDRPAPRRAVACVDPEPAACASRSRSGRRRSTPACSAPATVRGRPVWDVSFFDPATPAWFEATIDQKTDRTLELDMTAASHFMHHVYGPFDAPMRLHAAHVGSTAWLSRSSTHRSTPSSQEQEAEGVPPVEELSPEELRANYAKRCKEQWGALDEVHSVEDIDADGVPVRIYRPVETDEPSMALVYFHGGGWVIGSIETHDGPARAFAKRAGIVVISVDYRLAPEHPYPAALDDAWAATTWVSSTRRSSSSIADRIGVGGDSAGGTLAAIVARRGRDHAVPFALQLLLYPVTNSAADTPSYSLYSSGYGLTRDGMEWYWKQYLGDADGDGTTRHLACAADGSAAAAARDRRHGRGRRAARRGRGLRAAALPRDGRDRGLPLRRDDPRLPAHGRQGRALERGLRRDRRVAHADAREDLAHLKN